MPKIYKYCYYCFVCYQLIFCYIFYINTEYLTSFRYTANFYFQLSQKCLAKPAFDFMFLDKFELIPRSIAPEKRVLVVCGFGNTAPGDYDAYYLSNKLEVAVLKGRSNKIHLATPNLLSFSIIDTDNVDTLERYFKFPKLRVINFIVIRFNRKFPLPNYGSNVVEIIRIHRMESSWLEFKSPEKFSNLRVFELTQWGDSTLSGFCEFFEKLTKIEKFLLGQVWEYCLPNLLKHMERFSRLKILHLYNSNLFLTDGNFCDVIPYSVEYLYFGLRETKMNLTKFSCFTKLKVLEINIEEIEPIDVIYSPSTSFKLVRIIRREYQTNIKYFNLTNVVIATLHALYSHTNRLPPLPNTQVLRFSSNNFEFNSKIDPFPDCQKLRVLDLSDNRISHIPKNVFNKLIHLNTIILKENPIYTFEDTTFCNLNWPRILYFGVNTAKRIKFRSDKSNRNEKNSLTCFMDFKNEASLIMDETFCKCDEFKNNYLNPIERNQLLFYKEIDCENQNVSLFEFYEARCPVKESNLPYSLSYNGYESNKIFKNQKYFIFMVVLWSIYLFACCIPPILFYLLYKRKCWKAVVYSQKNQIPKSLFIICPKPARKWCRHVIIPCLEADMFSKSKPRLKRISLTNEKKNIKSNHGSNNDQNKKIINNSKSISPSNKDQFGNYEKYSHTKNRSNHIVSSSSSSSLPSVVSSGEVEFGKPIKPWSWRPRFVCHLAPPARHRLPLLMDSKQVLIVFPSSSLFTEPACRAQIRLAFHLHRENYIPPPGILIWPTNKTFNKTNKNHDNVNRNTQLQDDQKYYPAPLFDSLCNKPDDFVERVTIKAKVPSYEETIEILQYFSTLNCPCVIWSNQKSVRDNLKPFIWAFNKDSQIPSV